MGWDETLFGWFWKKARGVSTTRVTPEETAREALLAPMRERLRLAASALAETPIEIREAEREGGFSGKTFWLPSAMRLGATREANEDAYLLRVLWSVVARRRGFSLGASDPIERALATALAARAIRSEIVECFPGARERLDALEEATCVGRPGIGSPGTARALEALIRERLCRPLAARPEDHAREQAWISAAALRRPGDRAELRRATEELLAPLLALGGATRAIALPSIWGAIGSLEALPPTESTSPHAESALPTGTELRARAREMARRVELSDDALGDNPLVHSFEKVHTAEEHRGGSKNTDGSDELADHAAALDELDLREVVRSTDRTESLLRCDVMMEGSAGDLLDADDANDAGIPYDEWNEKERCYRPAWCRVRARRVRSKVKPAEASAFAGRLRAQSRKRSDEIRAELERIEQTRRWRSRQLDGPEIDDDAVVDRLAALRSGHTGAERLYRAKLRHGTELAVLVLLDASLSTDGWVGNRRVLDVELESTLAIAEALEGLDVELGIATFHSNTRRDCRFSIVKGMDETWASASLRLASIEPAGYTRMGPALRHATHLLGRTGARRRLLLLLTDGKPNDYDRYEGSYGIADVRQAVREAERERVHVHALAFDREARFHLPLMLGATRHSVVSAPEQLALAMGRVCADMRR